MRDHPLINPELEIPPTRSAVDRFGVNSDSDSEIVTLSRNIVLENAVFSFFADHIADKSGREVPRYLSVVPGLLKNTIAGVAVPPVHEDQVGLIQVFQHPLARCSWEAIKGHIESGENVRDAAVRELLEEAGFFVVPEMLVDFGAVAPESGVIQARIQMFTVMVNEDSRHDVFAELGHGEIYFFNPEEIDNLIENDHIFDATTLVILLKQCIKKTDPITA